MAKKKKIDTEKLRISIWRQEYKRLGLALPPKCTDDLNPREAATAKMLHGTGYTTATGQTLTAKVIRQVVKRLKKNAINFDYLVVEPGVAIQYYRRGAFMRPDKLVATQKWKRGRNLWR